jgi:O-antigen ligase
MGLPMNGRIAYTIHNGFLSAFVRFGWLGGLAFGGFMLTSFWFCVRRSAPTKPESWAAALIVATVIIYNLTEDFGVFAGQPLMVFAIFLGYYSSQHLPFAVTQRQNTL